MKFNIKQISERDKKISWSDAKISWSEESISGDRRYKNYNLIFIKKR